MTRVAIVADSAVLRAGLASLVEGDGGFVLVGAIEGLRTPSVRAALSGGLHEHVASLDADVVVWVPGRDHFGLPTAERDDEDERDERMDGDVTAPRVIVFVESADTGSAVRVLRAGARAVLAMDSAAEDILAVVRAVAAGLMVLPSQFVSEALSPPHATELESSGHSARRALPAGSALTPRELEVLTLLSQGLPNKAIAPRLGISEHTVKAHVAAIYDKVGAGNRAEAVLAAARLGLLML